ncbi:MAG: radical SAM protein [Deltaproteobacteria bacterium]|nr:radical SAM protein [Deltaproteobacteria bacterium]
MKGLRVQAPDRFNQGQGFKGSRDGGFTPYLISWNITKRCNLRCSHCYLDASELAGSGELSTQEALRLVDEIADINPHTMLILTGGEPLLRGDTLDLAGYATRKGLTVVIGSNGTTLDDTVVSRMMEAGVKGVGVSLDSVGPSYHDRFRGLPGAWERTDKGIDILRQHGLDFQIQVSVTKDNIKELPQIIEYSHRKGARAVNIFFLVCTGRGQEVTDITPSQYEGVLRYIAEAEREYEGRMMVRARCAPHFLRVASEINPDSSVLKGATSGCIAGAHYFRITPVGDITPCPYMPIKAGNIKERGLAEVWWNSQVFQPLRNPNYNGRCKNCEFNDICGGCRARAYAATGDMMGEDPWCEYEPKVRGQGPAPVPMLRGKQGVKGTAVPFTVREKKGELIWTKEALERLERIPAFLRQMVKKGVEAYARRKGLKEITPEIMKELRKRAYG